MFLNWQWMYLKLKDTASIFFDIPILSVELPSHEITIFQIYFYNNYILNHLLLFGNYHVKSQIKFESKYR